MILDRIESSEWLPVVFNDNLSDEEYVSLERYVDDYTMSKLMKIGCDPVPLYPFLKTMEFDLLEVYDLLEYGTNQYIMHWPTNGEIVFESLKVPGDMHNLMNSSDFYNHGFIDDNSIRLYHLCYDSHTQTSGGICLFINRQTNNIKIFGIGEDDGYMFPELNSFINYEVKGINQYELFALCSMVNDINATGLDNQVIIDKLYNLYNKN